jgi:hypothetical protein
MPSPLIFTDTSAWLAWDQPTEPKHRAASQFMALRPHLVTSNFIIDETITLALSRYGRRAALELGDTLWQGTMADIRYISLNDQREAWAFFKQYADKRFSFTDCTSFALMRRLGLAQAFSFDEDFEQTGLFARVPR